MVGVLGHLPEVFRGNFTPLCAALLLYELQFVGSRGSVRAKVLELEHADGLLDLLSLHDHKGCALGVHALLQGWQCSFLPGVTFWLDWFWAGSWPEERVEKFSVKMSSWNGRLVF